MPRSVTGTCRATVSCSRSSSPNSPPAIRCSSAPATAPDWPADRRSARDVLRGEGRPGRAQQHPDVDALEREPPDDVAPEDRGTEEVDERQPVARRQIRGYGRGGVQG